MENPTNLKDLPINFIVVDVLNPRESIVAKFPVWFRDFLLQSRHFMSEHLGIPMSLPGHQLLLFENILRRAWSMPLERAWSMPFGSRPEMFVCLVISDSSSVQHDNNQLECAESGFSMEFNVVTGVQVKEEEAVSWDLADDGDVNHVLRVCKPPIPCLRKMNVGSGSGSGLDKEELTCPVCLGGFPVGSEAVRTNCSHVYHGRCIVPWLARRNSCPMCRCRLHTG